MKKIFIAILFLSGAMNIILSVSHYKQREHNEVLLWENINLRGYKDAYLNHNCDTTHKNCLRGK